MSARTCWSCRGEVAAAEPLCPACGKVQPPPPAGAQADKFAVLGLAPSFDEPDGLDEKFRTLSRKLHPDRFARASAQERRFSLEQTTLLNDAYKTLKDPVRRAEHVLALRGVRGDPRMSPAFLEETLEDRERLLEAKTSGAPLDALAAGVREKRDRTLRQVRDLVQGGGDLAEAAELLARMRYYARYLDEVEGRAVEM
ncbi:MAG TPA: Fe-S protein assembly co-chaperone HscB [Myxococcales bacterium]|nr:Fe-S protein assembly co-chaperone HscB [Myxococcales bacterium]